MSIQSELPLTPMSPKSARHVEQARRAPIGSPFLTPAHSAELQKQICDSHRGMAHKSGSGPPDKSCSDCARFGPKRLETSTSA